MVVQKPGKSLNMKWGEAGEELGVVTRVGNSIFVDTGSSPCRPRVLGALENPHIQARSSGLHSTLDAGFPRS